MDRDVQNPGIHEGAAMLSQSEDVAQDILTDDAVREGKKYPPTKCRNRVLTEYYSDAERLEKNLR